MHECIPIHTVVVPVLFEVDFQGLTQKVIPQLQC